MPDVTITSADGVQILRLTRPEKKNALTAPMYKALSDALQAGDADPAVAVHVFMGSGGVFSAGNDIADFLEHARGTGSLGAETVRFIRLLPLVRKPMIAAVDGLAIGIGTTLLLHCDLAYASPAASLRTPFLDLGIVPEAGSSLLMPMRIGYARAFQMLCLGEPFTAEQALTAGLVNAVVPADRLEETALAAARRLAAKPPEALATARRMMRGEPSEIEARIDAEIAEFRTRLASPEAREAFEAFLAKRPPDFAKLRRPG
jgi:enoyl-CoA hydratase/carnithine racemase